MYIEDEPDPRPSTPRGWMAELIGIENHMCDSSLDVWVCRRCVATVTRSIVKYHTPGPHDRRRSRPPSKAGGACPIYDDLAASMRDGQFVGLVPTNRLTSPLL